MDLEEEYLHKRDNAIKQLKDLLVDKSETISLKEKSTSHFFRQRVKRKKLNLLNFKSIIKIDPNRKFAEVEGLISFYDLSNATMKYGLIPAVTPELRAITVGGTISGLGVEATSFRYGMVHDTLLNFDLLTAEGKVLNCSERESSDLFFTVPNALGTLGYVLKATIKLIPIKPFVKVELYHFSDITKYFASLEEWCLKKNNADFLDGVIFSPNHGVIIVGYFIDNTPSKVSLFDPLISPYFVALENKNNKEMYLTTYNYLWRWDYDCYWGTRGKLPADLLLNPIFRKLFGKYILRSDRLLTLRRKLNHIKQTWLSWLPKDNHEDLLQDAGVPLKKCLRFFNWYDKEISGYPLWICPVKAIKKSGTYPLSKWDGPIVVDIGFYLSKKLPKDAPNNFYNRQIEKKLDEIGAVKGLYSTSFYTKEEFWKMYDEKNYRKVKEKYDAKNSFPDLYQKAVGFKTK
jgi:hypothetical protein